FLPPPVSGQRVREDDARMLVALKVFPQSGLDTGVLVAATRYFGDNLRRIAQSQVEFFKASLMDPLLESGMSIPDVLERLAPLSFGGRVVKTLGDGVMFHFADPAGAILCGLAMVERAERLGLPRARMGVNAGKVVFRDGDYFGRTVNIAARIADYARPGEVL